MPANVDQMFSVRLAPWHREGDVLDDYPQTWDEARVLAGLDWDPEEFEVFSDSGLSDDEIRADLARILLGSEERPAGEQIEEILRIVRGAYPKIDGWQRVGRSDTRETLAVTKESYAIIRHSEFGEILEAVLEQDRDALKVETGGVLEGGTKVWMLVLLDEPVVIGSDSSPTLPYAALTSRHDAQGGCTLRATAVRIVCANTFRAAEMEGETTGTTFTFRHSKNWRDHFEDARQAIRGVRREFAEYVQLSEDLLGIRVTPGQREIFVTAFIPKPPDGLVTDRVSRNVDEARTALRAILDGRTVEGSGIGGTAYGLVQGAGEYLDHVRTARTWETRLNRTIIKPERLKGKATRLAREVALADA